MKRSTLGLGTLLALAALFIGLTALSNFTLRGLRLDLTENRLYTLTPGTERIVRSLDEPVNLYFFFSDEAATALPGIKTYGARVREFLQELVAKSDGKLRLQVIDPAPFSEDEDRAAEFGLRAVPIGGTAPLYFGLAGSNSTDGSAVIEFFDPAKEQFLEYELAKLIHQLGATQRPVVGWLSSLPMQGGFDPASGQMTEPWAVLAQAQQLLDVRQLPPELQRIDPEIEVLVLVHPKQLAAQTLFAIDQFALRGGRILLFLDPLAEADNSGAEPGNPLAALGMDRASNLGPLLTAWGIKFDPQHAIGDLNLGLTVSMQPGQTPSRHIGILGLDATRLDPADIVTAGLSNINVSSIGYLEPLPDSALQWTPLLQSSSEAGLLPVDQFAMLMDPATLRDGFTVTGQRYTLAARITGNIKSAFPDGLSNVGTATAGNEILSNSSAPLNLLVVADSDLLSDFLWVRQQNFFGQRVAQAWANNGDFVWNALDNLAGSSDLIGVRGRATFSRPFDRVQALRSAAEDRFRDKEVELEQQLAGTEERLAALESQGADGSGLILSPEQSAEIERFQAEKLRIRKELRDVRLGLDQDIEALGNRVKLLNVLVAPAIFGLLALSIAFWRRRRHAAIVQLHADRQRPAA